MEYFGLAGFLSNSFTSLIEAHNFPGLLLLFIIFYVVLRMFSWTREIHKTQKVSSVGFTFRLNLITCCAWLCCVHFK